MNYKTLKYSVRWKAINKNITKDHLIRDILSFARSLDLSKLEENFRKSGRGQHPFPLWMPLATWLYAYFQGEQRYRQAADKCASDDYYYWISGGLHPSAAYLEIWKLRIFAVLPDFLDHFRQYLKNKNYINNEIIGLDGVKVEVWASLSQSKTEDSINKEITKIAQQISELPAGKASNRLSRRKKKLIQRKAELAVRKQAAKHLSEQDKAKMKINITSPSTGIMKRIDGEIIQGVNIQLIVNQNQIVNIHSVERQPMDNGLLYKMLILFLSFWQIARLTLKLLCDSGYWGIKDIKQLTPELIACIIMPSPKEVAISRNKAVQNKGKGWSMQDGFTYNSADNIIYCPQNKKLSQHRIEKKPSGRDLGVYRANKNNCTSCSQQKQCLGKIKANVKTIKIAIALPEIDQLNLNYDNNRLLYKKRAVINEPVHSQMLNNVGIQKLHTIAQASIEGEVAMIILVHTLKKMLKFHGSGWINEQKYIFFDVFLPQNLSMFRRVGVHPARAA